MAGRLRSCWNEGRTAFGAWVMMSGPAAVEVIGALGFDYVCVDCQHGLLAYDDMRDLLLTLNGIETSPVVRVPANDPWWIGKALDAGAEAVIVPLVDSAEDARRAADACRYPPRGGRSFGPARRFLPFGADPNASNDGVICLPMIETRAGLAAADAICSTEGVDGIYVGPFDLGLSLGIAPFSPDHENAITTIREACVKAGVVPAIHALGGAMAKSRSDEGFRMVTVIDDAGMLARTGQAELQAARGS